VCRQRRRADHLRTVVCTTSHSSIRRVRSLTTGASLCSMPARECTGERRRQGPEERAPVDQYAIATPRNTLQLCGSNMLDGSRAESVVIEKGRFRKYPEFHSRGRIGWKVLLRQQHEQQQRWRTHGLSICSTHLHRTSRSNWRKCPRTCSVLVSAVLESRSKRVPSTHNGPMRSRTRRPFERTWTRSRPRYRHNNSSRAPNPPTRSFFDDRASIQAKQASSR